MKHQKLLRPKQGIVSAVLTRADGSIQTFEQLVGGRVNNLIVDMASIAMASALKGGNITWVTHMAVGTDNTAEAVGQVELIAEAARVPVTTIFWDEDNIEGDTLIWESPADGTLTNKIKITGEFGPGIAGTFTEIGLFAGPGASVANGGIMVARKVFPAWIKDTTSTIAWSWRLIC